MPLRRLRDLLDWVALITGYFYAKLCRENPFGGW